MEDKREQLLSLLQSANELAQDLQSEITRDGTYRKAVGTSAVTLQRSLQAPGERAWEIFFYTSVLPLIRVAIESGWLDRVAKSDSKGVTVTQLASDGTGDASLLSRVLRCLSRVEIVDEVGPQTYAPNRMTKLFTASGMGDGALHFNNLGTTVSQLPLYFSNIGYKNPSDVVWSPYAYAEGAPMWQDFTSRPYKLKVFDNFMGAVRNFKKDWFDTYPIEKLRIDSDSDVLLIDIGGGLGHDLLNFNSRRKPLGLPGRLILQERGPVLAKVPDETRKEITHIEHDFFSPQPDQCQHARAYYFRLVMHNWPDPACVKILQQVRDAMKPGYSTLFINDQVLPEENCPFFEAFFDIFIMAALSGKQRTKADWENLISQVDGLEIEKIWAIEEEVNYESVIEIVRTV